MPLRNLALLAVLFGTAGCSTLPNGRGWGQDVWFPPPKDFFAAAKEAFLNPWTWVPLVGALVVQIDDWDERITDWAFDRDLLFGDTEDADEASDNLRDVLYASAIGTSLATNSGSEPMQWTFNRPRAWESA